MQKFKTSDYKEYSKFIENLAKKLTKFYHSKLNKPFKVSNKLKGKGYDPVTSADKAFEKFIRKEIRKKFPNHQVIFHQTGISVWRSSLAQVLGFSSKALGSGLQIAPDFAVLVTGGEGRLLRLRWLGYFRR